MAIERKTQSRIKKCLKEKQKTYEGYMNKIRVKQIFCKWGSYKNSNYLLEQLSVY
jgi:hypothetical protein